MASQTQNSILWLKLFVTHGVNGLFKTTGVTQKILYKIKKDPTYVPEPRVQRKLSSGLQIPIDEMFPFSIEEEEAA